MGALSPIYYIIMKVICIFKYSYSYSYKHAYMVCVVDVKHHILYTFESASTQPLVTQLIYALWSYVLPFRILPSGMWYLLLG